MNAPCIVNVSWNNGSEGRLVLRGDSIAYTPLNICPWVFDDEAAALEGIAAVIEAEPSLANAGFIIVPLKRRFNA